MSLMFVATNPDVGVVQDERNPSLMTSGNIGSFTSCGKMTMFIRGLGPQSQVGTSRL